jgi:UDP-N-acetylmuramoyl-tripeptide--D-alanyl-D-alanine ligase
LHKPPKDWDPKAISYNIVGDRAPGHVIVCMTPVSWGRQRPDTSKKLATWVRGGALAAIVQNEQIKTLPRLPKRYPLLVVRNTRQALRDIGLAARKRFEGRVIALTGTVGKTTTREMLRHVLDRQGGASANGGNNNNIPGVQRTLASTPAEHGYCVLEMGFGNPIDGISISSTQARPHVGMVTTVAAAHLDVVDKTKGSPLAQIADAKARVFEGLEDDGTAVVGLDHAETQRVLAKAKDHCSRILTFGEHADADFRLTDCELRPDGSSVTCMRRGDPLPFELAVVGRHMAQNAVGVLAAVDAAGGEVEQAARDIAEFKPVFGRSAISTFPIAEGEATLIDDSFNATPSSVRSSLGLLGVIQGEGGGRRVAVLGDILHLGPSASKLHAELAPALAESGVDLLFTNGQLMRSLYDAAPKKIRGSHTTSLEDLYRDLRESLKPGDVVALKSGRGQGGLGDLGFRRLAAALREGRETWD